MKKKPPLGTVLVTLAQTVSSLAAPTTCEEGESTKLVDGMIPGVASSTMSAVSDSPALVSIVKEVDGRIDMGFVMALVMLN